MEHLKNRYKSILAIAMLALLSGCSGGMMDPHGPVAQRESHMIVTATLLMLIVVIPVILLAIFFAWKYRASNTSAEYDPEWSHSTKIEIIVWLIPIVIIAILGWLMVRETHALDPFKRLQDVSAEQKQQEPVVIEAISLDWKWLFVYPQYNIATVNEIKFPVNREVLFKITSDTVFNSLSIPQLSGQMYAMAGMDARLHTLASKPGVYDGFSAMYSGYGFSNMKFKAYALDTEAEFDAWIQNAKNTGTALDANSYKALASPKPGDDHKTVPDPVTYYSSVTPNLYMKIIDKYMSMRGGMDAMHKSDRAPDATFMKPGEAMQMNMHGGEHHDTESKE